MDINLSRLPIRTIKVGDKLVLKVSQTLEKDTLFLNIIYLGGKFSLEKVFRNTLNGRENLELAIKEFSNEQAIKSHFGL